MTNGHPMSRIDDLLPWNWKVSHRQNLAHVPEMDAYAKSALSYHLANGNCRIFIDNVEANPSSHHRAIAQGRSPAATC